MMRQIVLDTETTGLAVDRGHRIVELGCVELLERRPSGRQFQRYINPERSMDPGASEVNGLFDEFLADKPKFAEIVDEFVEFIDGAELIIHNAAFDLGFLDAEFSRLGGELQPLAARCPVTDTLIMARDRYPGQRNSLDALCRRLQVDNAHRTLHGALLDAQLLAEVYLALTAGQGSLWAENSPVTTSSAAAANGAVLLNRSRTLRVVHASVDELALHEARVAALERCGKCLWTQN